jgi:hypothetical protein
MKKNIMFKKENISQIIAKILAHHYIIFEQMNKYLKYKSIYFNYLINYLNKFICNCNIFVFK